MPIAPTPPIVGLACGIERGHNWFFLTQVKSNQYGPALLVQCQLAQELSKSLVEEWLQQYMLRVKATRERRPRQLRRLWRITQSSRATEDSLTANRRGLWD